MMCLLFFPIQISKLILFLYFKKNYCDFLYLLWTATYIVLAFHSLTIFRNCKYIAILKSLKTENQETSH